MHTKLMAAALKTSEQLAGDRSSARTSACRRSLQVAVLVFLSAIYGQWAAAGTVGHVIHVSVDGLRGDYLESRISSNPLLYSNFKRFVDEGATTFNARTDYTHTETLPNHTSMLTGRPVLQPNGAPATVHHGYTNNGTPSPSDTLHNAGNPNVAYIASTFDQAHDHGLSTALYASKDKFVIYEQSYNATAGAPDTIGPDNGNDKIDTYVYMSTGSPANASNLHAAYLADMVSSQYNYTFLHYRDPDSAGHAAGWGSATWDTSVQNVDDYLGDLFQLIENTPGLAGDTAIVLTADHGGTGTGHGTAATAANYTVPVMVWGPGVAPGADLYALNPYFRLDPGAGRPEYTGVTQPIRNGDTGNLALELLGLTSIPGSLVNGFQELDVASHYAADFDGNQSVNQLDFANWEAGFGAWQNAQKNHGDADLDRDVDGFDFLTWQQEAGASLWPLVVSNAAPEPSALSVGLLAVLCSLGSRSIGFLSRPPGSQLLGQN
ncbi:MAG: alkaline phosphatase family protein [Planctomycetales bacterium]|nr:alkaline phosphatase family protein [Planctomycetales bacterium]